MLAFTCMQAAPSMALGPTADPAVRRAVEGTPMVVPPIAAGPHLIVNYQPGQPHGGPGHPVGMTIGTDVDLAAFAHRGRPHPVGLVPFGQYNHGDALALVAALRRLADWIEAAAAPEACGNVFRREGEYWTVRYEGSVALLTDAKGLRYLARLLGNPGREYHAVDLATADSQTARPAPPAGRAWADSELRVRSDLGDAGALLDAQAKAAYHARLGELEAELEEAQRCNDPGRAVTAAAERDFLIGELARAVGLGGRGRRAASHAERARLNVTRAIRAAMDNLARANPSLGRHLAVTIRTGRYCSYTPRPPRPDRLGTTTPSRLIEEETYHEGHAQARHERHRERQGPRGLHRRGTSRDEGARAKAEDGRAPRPARGQGGRGRRRAREDRRDAGAGPRAGRGAR
jgi:hypothetical protein